MPQMIYIWIYWIAKKKKCKGFYKYYLYRTNVAKSQGTVECRNKQIHMGLLSQHWIFMLDMWNAVDRKDGKHYVWDFNYATLCPKPIFLLHTFPYTSHFINSKMHIYPTFNTSEALSHFTWQQFFLSFLVMNKMMRHLIIDSILIHEIQ